MATRTPSKHQPPLIRPSYKAAIQWMADNDDTDWVGETADDDGPISVSAALVADLFGAEQERVTESLRKALKKARR